MQRAVIFAIVMFPLRTPAIRSAAADDARAVIERAINAQGGAEQVARLTRAWRAKVRGMRGERVTTGEMAYQSPDQMRIQTTMEVDNRTMTFVGVLNGEKGWQSINGQTRAVEGRELEEMRDGAHRSRRVRFLLPLLKEPEFTLSVLDDKEIIERPTTGVRVQSKGHRDIDLYFDKESGLLVATESQVVDPTGKVLTLRQVFSEYKDPSACSDECLLVRFAPQWTRPRVHVHSQYFASTSPTSMYCPPPVCLQWTASVFWPRRSACRAASSRGTKTYCVT